MRVWMPRTAGCEFERLLREGLDDTVELVFGEAVPEPPEIPPRVQSGEKLEPEVTVRRDGQKTVTEYRLNGRLQSIKVQPVAGPTYWLVDTTGDGFTDTRYDNYNPPFAIPGWVLFRW